VELTVSDQIGTPRDDASDPAPYLAAFEAIDADPARLLVVVIDRARERGCAIVQLTSNKERLDAHRFYGRLGFKATHEGFKLRLG
jgi:GNAT superfamily N-acetyltransferase